MKVTAVIMAGGRGERFWPKSRVNYPKQFLSLTSDGDTMIQKTVKRLLPLVSMVAIVLIIATVVALNAGQFAAIGPIVALAVILHNGIGITAGYWVSRWLGFDERICRTIAFEVGLQNSGLATALAMKFFTPASAVAGTLFSVWHNLSGSLLAGFWARRPLLLAERQTGAVVKDH